RGWSRRSVLRKKEGVSQSDANAFFGQLDELIPVVPVPAIRGDGAQLSRFRNRNDPIQFNQAELCRIRLVEMPSTRCGHGSVVPFAVGRVNRVSQHQASHNLCRKYRAFAGVRGCSRAPSFNARTPERPNARMSATPTMPVVVIMCWNAERLHTGES